MGNYVNGALFRGRIFCRLHLMRVWSFPLCAARSVTCQNMCCQWFPPLEAALMLYNDSRPFSTTPATDATGEKKKKKKKKKNENYRHGFLPITDCSANQLSVPINRQNRLIGRPLITRPQSNSAFRNHSITKQLLSNTNKVLHMQTPESP